MDNKHTGWIQGRFVDQRQYSRRSAEEKQKADIQEKLNVRPSPLGNPLCRTQRPEDAAWIAERLNSAAELEDAYGIAQDFIAHLEKRIAKAIEIAGSMKSLDAHRRLMEVLEGE